MDLCPRCGGNDGGDVSADLCFEEQCFFAPSNDDFQRLPLALLSMGALEAIAKRGQPLDNGHTQAAVGFGVNDQVAAVPNNGSEPLPAGNVGMVGLPFFRR